MKPKYPRDTDNNRELQETVAVMRMLDAADGPVTAEDIATRFSQGRRITDRVDATLSALLRMGHLSSTDEGKSWQHIRHVERDMRDRQIATSSGYPSIIQGRDGTLHVVYSYHHKDREGGPSKTIKYVQFNETWVKQGKTSQRK